MCYGAKNSERKALNPINFATPLNVDLNQASPLPAANFFQLSRNFLKPWFAKNVGSSQDQFIETLRPLIDHQNELITANGEYLLEIINNRKFQVKTINYYRVGGSAGEWVGG